MASGLAAGPVSHAVAAGTVMREPEGEGESRGVFDTILGGLMGDFREDPTLAEIGINTGVGLIPVVGEVTAARDVTANIYSMVDKEEYTSPGRWLGLTFALVSLFPEIGAALKGLGKAVLKGAAEAVGPIVRLMERVLEKLGHSEGIRSFFLKNWGRIASEGTALFERVMARLTSLLSRAVRFVSSKAEAFAQGLERLRQAAVKALPEALERAKNMFESVLERFEKAIGRKAEQEEAKALGEGAEKAVGGVEKQITEDAAKVEGGTKAAGETKEVGQTVASSGAKEGQGAALENANFAQKKFGETFSEGGKFAGKTIDEVAEALRTKALTPKDVPIEYIVRDGNTLILNTRSAQALERAGIPRSQWHAVNMTGDAAAEARLTGQLQRNKLTSRGTPTVRPSKGK
jgi:hypothetical protein